MAKKKNNLKKSSPDKSMMIKIAEKVGELAGRVVNEKEHLAGIATGAIKSVKATFHNITAEKKSAGKKTKKAVVKKAGNKSAGPVVKKIKKAVLKKAAPVKKSIKKVAKKAAKKVTGKK